MKRHCTIIATALALLIGFASPAVASEPTIYGSAYVSNGPASLYNIDPTTGAATLIGAIGFNQVGGIDFDPLNGLLYGTGQTAGGTRVLLSINPLTGAGTEIGALGIINNIADISFRSDGTLFADDGTSGGHIYTINLATGGATAIGNFGTTGAGNALAFSPADTLFLVNGANVYTVNQTNGAGTAGPATNYAPLSGTPRADGMDFDPATGTLWASVTTTGGPTYLDTIDPSTGDTVLIGQTQTGIDALAVAPEAAVPEPSTWAGLFVAVGGMMLVAKRRRSRSAS